MDGYELLNTTKFAMLKLDESFVLEAIAKVFTICSPCVLIVVTLCILAHWKIESRRANGSYINLISPLRSSISIPT